MSKEESLEAISPDQCARDVMEAIPLIMRFIRSEMRNQRSSALSIPQFRALAFLDRYPGSSLSEVAEHLGVTRPTASTMVERLVQRGLVDRMNDPLQRRQVVLQLTTIGQEQLEKVRLITRTKIAEIFTNLSDSQLQKIHEGLGILMTIFRDY